MFGEGTKPWKGYLQCHTGIKTADHQADNKCLASSKGHLIRSNPRNADTQMKWRRVRQVASVHKTAFIEVHSSCGKGIFYLMTVIFKGTQLAAKVGGLMGTWTDRAASQLR